MNIIVKKYEHYNRALGKHITSKRHYESEMRKQGMVSLEEGQRLAEKKTSKPYNPSKKALELIQSISLKGTEKGKIKLGSREIDAMKELGVNFDQTQPIRR